MANNNTIRDPSDEELKWLFRRPVSSTSTTPHDHNAGYERELMLWEDGCGGLASGLEGAFDEGEVPGVGIESSSGSDTGR